MTRLLFRGAPLVALLAVTAVPPDVSAARILKYSVSVDGRERLWGDGADNGQAPPDVVWRRLATTPLTTADGADPVTPDSADQLRATLRGDIVVEVTTAGRAKTSELRLVRATPTSGWTVAPEDVNQLGRSLGFGEPTVAEGGNVTPAAPAEEPAPGPPLWVWVGGAIAAALFVVGLVVRMGLNQSPPSRLVAPQWDPAMDVPEAEVPNEYPAEGGNEYPEEYPEDPSAQEPR